MRLDALGIGASSGIAQHATLGAGRFQARELTGDPDTQVAQTMRLMGQRVTEDAANPIFQAYAARVFAGIDPNDKEAIIDRAYQHVHDSIHFQRDEVTGEGLGDIPDLVEFIVRPVDMARYIDQGNAIGDCDDFAMMLAALLATHGIPSKFCTVAASDIAPDQFSHVYVVTYLNGERIALDSSHGEYPGWEVPNRYGKRAEWSTSGGCPLITLAIVGAAAYFGWRYLESVAA